ncbi:MAG: hypothetical protein PHC84_01310 [Clostridia bacterium]|nr:hypothetical protein [Clostridia bacterium]
MLIKKVFQDKKSFYTERRELRLLKGLRVPIVVRATRNTLYITYIEGRLLLDEFLERESADMPQLACSLAAFILSFYRRRGVAPSDVTFRNFIVKENCCYGIDFEEPSEGGKERCVARLIGFCYLYDTAADKKTAFCAALLQAMGFGVEAVYDQAIGYISMLCERRKIIFDEESTGVFLNGLKSL